MRLWCVIIEIAIGLFSALMIILRKTWRIHLCLSYGLLYILIVSFKDSLSEKVWAFEHLCNSVICLDLSTLPSHSKAVADHRNQQLTDDRSGGDWGGRAKKVWQWKGKRFNSSSLPPTPPPAITSVESWHSCEPVSALGLWPEQDYIYIYGSIFNFQFKLQFKRCFQRKYRLYLSICGDSQYPGPPTCLGISDSPVTTRGCS